MAFGRSTISSDGVAPSSYNHLLEVGPAMSSDGLAQVRIDQISPNPYHPRQTFNDASIEDLARSVSEHSIVQPLVVTRTGDKVLADCRRTPFSRRAESR